MRTYRIMSRTFEVQIQFAQITYYPCLYYIHVYIVHTRYTISASLMHKQDMDDSCVLCKQVMEDYTHLP